MKEQFKKRKSSRVDTAEGERGQGFYKKSNDRPRSFDGPRFSDTPRHFSGGDEAPFEGGADSGRPPRSTFRREGAVGGWSPQFQQRPRREGGFDGPRREGGFGGPRRESGYGSPRREGGFGGPRRFEGNDRPRGREGGFGQGPQAPRREAEPRSPAARPVSAHKLKDGIKSANRAIAELMDGFGKGIAGAYDISALEAVVSFDAEGRFMGFGEGGAAAFTLTLTPLDAQDVFEHGDIDDIDDADETSDDPVSTSEESLDDAEVDNIDGDGDERTLQVQAAADDGATDTTGEFDASFTLEEDDTEDGLDDDARKASPADR